jgi:hypothetical protein
MGDEGIAKKNNRRWDRRESRGQNTDEERKKKRDDVISQETKDKRCKN